MANAGRGTTIATWVLSVVLAALYGFAGLPKIFGATEMAQQFAQWGYPAWFRVLIGLIEVAGAIGLLLPAVAFYAAGTLGAVMIGAIYTLFTAHDPSLPVPAVCLLLLGAVAYLRRPGTASGSR
jgi:uncharacterized membrane protein YphA (DoxX/SURF4 family)